MGYQKSGVSYLVNTVNVDICAQYIFSCILGMVSYTLKYAVSENVNHYRLRRSQCDFGW